MDIIEGMILENNNSIPGAKFRIDKIYYNDFGEKRADITCIDKGSTNNSWTIGEKLDNITLNQFENEKIWLIGSYGKTRKTEDILQEWI